jgi:hypothetical protein
VPSLTDAESAGEEDSTWSSRMLSHTTGRVIFFIGGLVMVHHAELLSAVISPMDHVWSGGSVHLAGVGGSLGPLQAGVSSDVAYRAPRRVPARLRRHLWPRLLLPPGTRTIGVSSPMRLPFFCASVFTHRRSSEWRPSVSSSSLTSGPRV